MRTAQKRKPHGGLEITNFRAFTAIVKFKSLAISFSLLLVEFSRDRSIDRSSEKGLSARKHPSDLDIEISTNQKKVKLRSKPIRANMRMAFLPTGADRIWPVITTVARWAFKGGFSLRGPNPPSRPLPSPSIPALPRLRS